MGVHSHFWYGHTPHIRTARTRLCADTSSAVTYNTRSRKLSSSNTGRQVRRRGTRTAKSRKRQPSPKPLDNSSNNIEDHIMELELSRLVELGGNAPPPWSGVEEFRDISRAIYRYALRQRTRDVGSSK